MAVAFVVIPLQELQKGHIQPHDISQKSRGCEPIPNTVLTLLTPGERKNDRFFFRPKIKGFFFGSWPKHPSWGLKARKRKIRTITMTPLTLTKPSGKKKGVIYLTSSPPKRCVGNQRLSQVFYEKFWKLTKNLIHFWASRNEESLVFSRAPLKKCEKIPPTFRLAHSVGTTCSKVISSSQRMESGHFFWERVKLDPELN